MEENWAFGCLFYSYNSDLIHMHCQCVNQSQSSNL